FDVDETEQIKGHLRLIIEDQLWEDIIDKDIFKLQSAYSQIPSPITLKFVINIVVSLKAEITIQIALIVVVVNLNLMDEVIAIRQQKLSNGLSTLERTNKEVEAMKTQLIAFKPRLEVSQKDTIAIKAELTVQQKEVEGKEEVVCEEEAIVTQQANEAETLGEDAQKRIKSQEQSRLFIWRCHTTIKMKE
ncbi:MAG: hypothetical protein EZS28_009516, partial [Streblomastix strix]